MSRRVKVRREKTTTSAIRLDIFFVSVSSSRELCSGWPERDELSIKQVVVLVFVVQLNPAGHSLRSGRLVTVVVVAVHLLNGFCLMSSSVWRLETQRQLENRNRENNKQFLRLRLVVVAVVCLAQK